jgi:hypothetical protein
MCSRPTVRTMVVFDSGFPWLAGSNTCRVRANPLHSVATTGSGAWSKYAWIGVARRLPPPRAASKVGPPAELSVVPISFA